MLPQDPIILLSFINTKLRDECKDLEDFCEKYEIDKTLILEKMSSINYSYSSKTNQFV